MDKYDKITFNPDKSNKIRLEALKLASKRKELKEDALGALFCVCLAVCLWFGLLLF